MKTRCVKAGPAAVSEGLRVVKKGGVIAIPTDTVYGLGCDPTSDEAVQMLFEVKNRQAKAVPLLCANAKIAEGFVLLNEVAAKLATAHWPGGLTIVAPLRPKGGLSRLLDQGSGSLGVRVPRSAVCVELAGKAGGAITGTSANVSGRPACRTAAEVMESLDGRIPLVIDGGRLRSRESTVVKVSGDTVEVLREGAVGIQEGELKA